MATIETPVFRIVGPEEDISHTLKRGRWAIVAGDTVVELRLIDPVGFLPAHIYHDISGFPDVDVGWKLDNGVFSPPSDQIATA